MGQPLSHPPVLALVAAFSRHEAALDWARQRIEQQWGAILLEGPRFEHRETRYYESSMGPDLLKTFWALPPFDPAQLPARKILSGLWEQEYAALGLHPEPRPLNLDPGYLTEAKLVLASTKDRDHRLYLHDGVFAEVTLHYTGGAWRERPWTYPDYRRPDYHEFFTRCRDHIRRTRTAAPASG